MKLIRSSLVVLSCFASLTVEVYQLGLGNFPSKNELNLRICTENILQIYGKSSTFLAYSNNTDVVNKVAELLINVQIRKLDLNEKLLNTRINRELVVIVFEDTLVLNYYLQSLSSSIESFVRVFLIYNGKEEIDSIFEITWRYYLVKVILVDNLSDIYSYRPYESSCKLVKSKYLYNCLDKDSDLTNIFNFEITSFNNCKITALTMKHPPYVIDASDPINSGYEAYIYHTASTIFNFKINFTLNNFSKWGYENPNETYTDGMKTFIENEEIDVMFGRLPANSRLLADFETTRPYLHSILAYYVPIAKQVVPLMNIMLVLDWQILALTSLTNLVINVASYAVTTVKKDPVNILDFINVAAIFSSQAIKLNNSVAAYNKFIFMLTIYFSLIITCSYNSVLMSFLTKPNYETQITTVSALEKSKLGLGGDYYAKNIAPTTPDFIKKKWIFCPINNSGECITRVIVQRDMALIEDVDIVRYYLQNGKLRELKSSLYKIKDHQHTSYIWAIVRKGHPLGRMINKLIEHFHEHGYETMWSQYFEIGPAPEKDSFAVVSIEHLFIPFGVCISGLVSSSLVFVWEMRQYWWKFRFTNHI